MLENMDTNSLQYSSYCFAHAMQNGFYTPTQPSESAKSIYATFRTDTLLTKYASQMSYQGPKGFWENESYTSIDLTQNLKDLKAKGVNIYALFGKEDGLYSEEQVMNLQKIIGKDTLRYLDNCFHSVFIDQQEEFIKSLEMWVK